MKKMIKMDEHKEEEDGGERGERWRIKKRRKEAEVRKGGNEGG